MKYMTVADVKDRWGVSSDVVYDYIATGRLKAVKFGRAWRIKQSDLETFERNKYTEDAAELRARRTGGCVYCARILWPWHSPRQSRWRFITSFAWHQSPCW